MQRGAEAWPTYSVWSSRAGDSHSDVGARENKVAKVARVVQVLIKV